MRGLYTASVLHTLERRFLREREDDTDTSLALDIGKGFDLIAGTSTGGILAACIAAGISLQSLRRFFQERGPTIFPRPLPSAGRFRKCRWYLNRMFGPSACSQELQEALRSLLRRETLVEVHKRREIALCITATNLVNDKPRVFKTPHLPGKDLDNDLAMDDVCMATSAAPVYFPIVSPEAKPDGHEYVDGGIWANNPMLVGLLEAIAMARPEQAIQLLSVGTCAPPPGFVSSNKLNVGLPYWIGDLRLLHLGMNSQASAAKYAADLLATSLSNMGRQVTALRCEETTPSGEQVKQLQLDSVSGKARGTMAKLGRVDGNETYRWTQTDNNPKGKVLRQIFERMPVINNHDTNGRSP